MKKLKPAERFELFMELGEWIFNDFDLDDELMVPQFKIKGNQWKITGTSSYPHPLSFIARNAEKSF